jgi:hypothetical protein
VFVRSDTNVEDLPGFTGAGLNLTVPNVVGFDAIVQAIQQVWASLFTERAYAWRQAHMDQPEHVYPAVLLLKTFDSEKSGVLVTTDVENGDRHWLSIAVSEGVVERLKAGRRGTAGRTCDGQGAPAGAGQCATARCTVTGSAACSRSRPVAASNCCCLMKLNNCVSSPPTWNSTPDAGWPG